MFSGGKGFAFGIQHLDSADQLLAHILGPDDLIDIPAGCRRLNAVLQVIILPCRTGDLLSCSAAEDGSGIFTFKDADRRAPIGKGEIRAECAAVHDCVGACSRAAVEATAARGITTGAHVILGLPGEDKEDMLRQAAVVSTLPIDILKVHHLQIVRGTRLALIHEQAPLPVFAIDDYIALLADYIVRLRPDIILERFVSQLPPGMVVAPRWGVKSQEFA